MVTARHDPPTRRVSEEEYLAFERAAQTKHELIDGRIVAMAGASPDHNFIQSNLIVALGTQLRGRNCVVVGSDMRVQVDEWHYFYPDVTIICGKYQFSNVQGVASLLNPTVVIEIASPTTWRRDVQEKLPRYNQIASLQHILIVAQDAPGVTVFTRTQSGDWTFTGAIGLESSLTLSAIGCTLALAEVYENVEFPPEDDASEGG
jgi:Uma2 family endonuclease